MRVIHFDDMAGMYNEGFMFCEKVKERLSSSDDYQAFLKCLNIYSNGIIKRNDLQNLVGFVFLFIIFHHIYKLHDGLKLYTISGN